MSALSCHKSYLGETEDGTVRVCAWCRDAKSATALCDLMGYAVTHGMCNEHAAEQLIEIAAMQACRKLEEITP